MSNLGSLLLDGGATAGGIYSPMGGIYAADWYVRESRDEGYYVATGCAVTASGTAGKVDMAAGTVFAGTTEVNITAVTAFATTITTLAAGLSSGQALWVACEIDPTTPTAALNFNSGSAAQSDATHSPLKPTPTSGRVVVAWLFVPFGATAVDALLTTNNGKAKIMEARVLSTARFGGRVLGYNNSVSNITNPTSLTSLLTGAVTLPANSLNLGDTLLIAGSGLYKNTQNNSTIEQQISFGTGSIFDYTSATLNLDGTNSRRWGFHIVSTCIAIGASAGFYNEGWWWITGPSASTNAIQMTTGGGANGDIAGLGAGVSATQDSTAAITIDLKGKITTSSSTATFSTRNFVIIKNPF